MKCPTHMDDKRINRTVVKNVNQMISKGKKLMEIDYYLLNEGKITQDEREEITEGLYEQGLR
jgi:hypothetical protein